MATTKQNTPGTLGTEYEVYVPAYFALLLNTNPEIEDYKLRSNVSDFGNLDDLLIDVKTKSGENLYFAFQLKHKNDSAKKINPESFQQARGDLSLEKYCKAFKKLEEENRKKYHFVLYTNSNFDSCQTSSVNKFCMKETQDILCNIFDTTDDGKHLYKFEVNGETEDGINVNKKDYEEFFSKFSLYTGQANAIDLAKFIFGILKYKEQYATYIDFFRKWHRGDFTDCNKKILDKKTLNVHLVDIFLSSVAINYHFSDGQDRNLIFFEELVQQFNITMIDASKEEFIKQLEQKVHKYPEGFNKQEDIIRLAKDHKFIDKFTKELSEETKLKLLHYLYQKPLILDFNESSKDLIYEASKLCKLQETGIKLVFMGKDIDVSKLSHLKIFTNLTEVDGNFLEETKRRCKLSLQGRNVSFEKIFQEESREFVTPRAIFQMLKGSFSIGEDKEKLPECYIPRTVSTMVFDIESIIKNSSRSNAIIFYYENKFKTLKTLIQKVVDFEDFLYEDFLYEAIILRKKGPSKRQLLEVNTKDILPETPTIILSKNECSRKQLNKIYEEIGKQDIHLFKVLDGKKCLMLMSSKNISCNENYKFTKMSVEDEKIHVFFNNSINVLCAKPGMGKSTLMKYLKNECDPNFWKLRVDLKAHNHYLKVNRKIEEVLSYFLQLEQCEDIFLISLKKMFLQKKKIAFFLDGLDEVENECIDNILNVTKQLSEMGFRLWLSSRQNLQKKIENYFNIFAIEIDELSENQEKKYIEERLTSQYKENEIEEIVEKIFTNTDLANNRQILEIPQQLHIITQIFLDDKSYYCNLNENNFILTKMFKIFFEGKYKHYLDKIEVKYTQLLGTLNEQLEKYEIVALHSALDDEHFQKLQIDKLKLTQIKNWDFLGIITEINSENKAVFEHLTFAEYFASKFLVKNFDKARILREEIFSEKYQNLLLIFNIMLAEDSPLHLAIIYKDLSRIQEIEEFPLVDKGGRNFLQIAACVATRHPLLDCIHLNGVYSGTVPCLVKDLPVKHFKGEDLKMKEIVNRVSFNDLSKNDKIFDWNSLDYALVTGALYVVEAILEKSEKLLNFYKTKKKAFTKSYYSDEVVAYYAIRFGYHQLLSQCCHVTRIISDYLRFTYSSERKSIIQFLFESDYTNRKKIVELLTGDDINKIVYEVDGCTLLHFAVFNGDTEFIKFLLEKGADINVQDKNWRSPLSFAVKRCNPQISKLLIENKADVNIKDKDELSPLVFAIQQDNHEISKLLIENGANVNIQTKEGWSPLLLAVNRNNFKISKLLVENGADVNIKHRDGKSPLFYADERLNSHDISKLLLENGADVNIQDKDGKSLLFYAVERNNFEFSKLLVEKGAAVDIKDKKEKTPLFLAVELNNIEISELLIEKGADVNIHDKEGWAPLLRAVYQNNLEILKLLMDKGADVNIKNRIDGWSALFWAVFKSNFRISKLLVEKEADVNIQDKDGWSPLLLAVEQNNFETTRLLIEKGADVNIQNKDGLSPLLLAVGQNNLEISKQLVEKGADVNIRDQSGTSLLGCAAKLNNLEISKFLVEKGADVNIQDDDGWSPLFKAVYQNNLKISKLLIEEGADVNIKNKTDGWSPLLWSSNLNNLEISQLLIEKGADVNIKDKYGTSPLFSAVKQNNLEISKLLIEKGADVNIKNKIDGWSPLLWATNLSNLEISRLLVEKGADVNIKDEDGKSPLLWATYQNNLEITKLLVERGADVNIKSINGESPLLWAAHLNNLEISQLLVEKGADVNIKDKYGWSPLHWAVKKNNLEISTLLVKNGADVNIKDQHGKTPLYAVKQINNPEITNLLFESGAEVNGEIEDA